MTGMTGLTCHLYYPLNIKKKRKSELLLFFFFFKADLKQPVIPVIPVILVLLYIYNYNLLY